MNSQSNAMPESPLDSQKSTPADMPATRTICWSVRRELWEHRSIYVAPLAAAAVYMLGFLISLVWVPHSMHHSGAPDSTPQIIVLAMPYAHAGMLLAITGFLVGIFYSLDALHGERRDRSILFWKSLPVSDLTTVLSKASIPLVVLPLLIFAIVVPLQIAMRLLNAAALLLSGGSVAPLWQLPLFQMELVLLYGLTVLALWHAPIYCWLLLVSGWAKRATFLWAVLPPLALCALEKIAFNTNYLVTLLLQDRFFGFAAAAFDLTDKAGVPIDPHFIPLAQLAPGRFLSSPGLWLGLVVAGILLAAAVRLRRYQGSI
jgi:ABC-2 type transport system permease protein